PPTQRAVAIASPHSAVTVPLLAQRGGGRASKKVKIEQNSVTIVEVAARRRSKEAHAKAAREERAKEGPARR
ncbi:hypothetical protein PIB30_090389, partial [Stylosanthes scabra]|nr:hypothetical protein [Stylosanthes scabra]